MSFGTFDRVRVFLAGASGVIGRRLVPLLVEAGHEVAGTTRTPGKAESLRELGAEPVVVDVYDAEALRDAVVGFEAEALIHQLTDLPDDPSRIPKMAAANARIRVEGTHNLLGAARAAGASRFVAQSIAWKLPADRGASIAEFESMVLDAGGVVLRYGQFYGPGTYYKDEPPPHPRIQIDEAARRTVPALDAPRGTIEIVED
jgi:nucleoside-diphosphate-sugar epimerase